MRRQDRRNDRSTSAATCITTVTLQLEGGFILIRLLLAYQRLFRAGATPLQNTLTFAGVLNLNGAFLVL